MFGKEGQYSGIDDTAEYLPQVAAHTDASVVVGVEFVSTLVNWGYKPLVPDVREVTST